MTDQPEEDLSKWVQRFIELGGLDQLQKVLSKALGQVQLEVDDEVSAHKKLVDKLLQVIRMFVMTAINPVEKIEQQNQEKKETQEPQPEEKEEKTKKDDKKVSFQEDSYKTPVKNNSSGQIQPKVSNFNVDDVEINQETLFGEDEANVGDEATEGKTNEQA